MNKSYRSKTEAEKNDQAENSDIITSHELNEIKSELLSTLDEINKYIDKGSGNFLMSLGTILFIISIVLKVTNVLFIQILSSPEFMVLVILATIIMLIGAYQKERHDLISAKLAERIGDKLSSSLGKLK